MLTSDDLRVIANISSSPFLQSLILRGNHCDAIRLAEAKDGEIIALDAGQVERIHEACRMPVYALHLEDAPGGKVAVCERYPENQDHKTVE